MTERARLQNVEAIGLLPHELEYVRRGLASAALSKKAADIVYGEAVADSGGDWVFDDPGSQAAAQAASAEGMRLRRQEQLSYLDTIDYPNPDSSVVSIGSRITLITPKWESCYDIVSRILVDMPVEDGVELLSAHGPLGKTLTGKKLGDTVAWNAPGGQIRGQLTNINQVAQRAYYEKQSTLL